MPNFKENARVDRVLRVFEKSPQLQGLRRPSPDVSGNRPDRIQPHARSIGETTTFQTPSYVPHSFAGLLAIPYPLTDAGNL